MAKSMTPDDLELVARFGTPKIIDATGHAPGSAIANLAMLVEKFTAIVAEFDRQAAHIRTDRRFTPEGKRSNLAQLGQTELARFAAFDTYLAGAKDALRKLRESVVVTDPNDADSPSRAIREWMILDQLPKDAMLVRIIFAEAIESGERDVYDAIRRAPRFMGVLPPADVAEGEAKWAEKSDPARGKAIRDLAHAIAVFGQARDEAMAHIRQASGIDSDPLRRAAEGDVSDAEAGGEGGDA